MSDKKIGFVKVSKLRKCAKNSDKAENTGKEQVGNQPRSITVSAVTHSLTHSLTLGGLLSWGGSPFEPCCTVITVVRRNSRYSEKEIAFDKSTAPRYDAYQK